MQLFRFLAVGIVNTVAGFACIVAGMRWLALDYRVANALGYAAGCGLGFVLNRAWTFADRGPWQGSLVRWLGVAGVCWCLNLLTVIVLHDRLGVDAYVAQVGGTVVYAAATFLGGRFVAFRTPARGFVGAALP